MARRARVDRAAVVDAAVRLVNAEGAGALSLSRVAGELGVRTPSLYNHIDGLPGLQRELALRNAQMLADAFADAAIGKAGADAVVALAQAFRAYIKANPGLYLAGQDVTDLTAGDDAALRAAMDRSVRIVAAVMASFGLEGDDALHAEALAYCEKLAQHSPPGLARMKRLAHGGLETTLADGLALESGAVVEAMRSADVAEGLAAFRERREPNFR